MRVHLALEGGGAGGIAHVGALHAIDEAGMDIRGVAGTSAGALVAGLVAAGYSGKELFDPGPAPFQCDRIASVVYEMKLRGASALLGPKWPNVIGLLRQLAWLDRDLSVISAASGLLAVNILIAAVLGPLGPQAIGLAVAVEIGLLIGIGFWVVRRLHRGLANLEVFVGHYNEALRRKLASRLATEPACDSSLVARMNSECATVTFDDIRRVTGRALHVVSANLATRDMSVFGTSDTPDASVARAVAASAGIPGLFAPVTVGHGAIAMAPHHDGGLVSNLPAWAFDDDLAADPDARVIAIRIADAVTRAPMPPQRTVDWIVALARTAVFGGSALNVRAMDGRLHVMDIRTDVGLLDFDLHRLDVARRVDHYRYVARTFLDIALLGGPERLNDACAAIETAVAAAIAAQAPGAPPGIVRAVLAEPVGAMPRFLRLVHGPSIRGRTEDGLLLPVDGSLVGAAWTGSERDGLFDAEPFAPEYNLTGPENRQRRALVNPDVKWRAAIPIFTASAAIHGRATMVLAIDGTGDANVASDALVSLGTMPEFAGRIASILDELAAKRSAMEDGT
jgi:NTE family protein